MGFLGFKSGVDGGSRRNNGGKIGADVVDTKVGIFRGNCRQVCSAFNRAQAIG